MTVRSQFWQLRNLVLGALGLTLVGGCETYPLGDTEPMLETPERGIKIANSLSTNALLFNGISTNAQANLLIRTNSLESLFNNASTENGNFIRNQLLDPNAQQFMKYLVSCALSSAQTPLPWQNSSGHGGTWDGGAGLCTLWRNGAPTESCLRQVSACILARNNAVNRNVALSFRGNYSNGADFSLEAQPSLVEYDPEVPATDLPIESFRLCSTNSTDINRDCGWSKDYIGSCTPNNLIRLGAGGMAKDANGQCNIGPLGSSTGPRTVLRVCDGIVGCNYGGPRFRAQSTGTCSSEQAPAVSFICPASGYFNVMKAPLDSSQQLGAVSVGVETTTQNPVAYRLSEAQVFRIREGAFYGNLFTGGVASEVTVGRDGTQTIAPSRVLGSVYPHMYVCHDPKWTFGAAYTTHRVCALPGSNENCAATVTNSCEMVGRGCSAPSLVHGDYDDCKDSSGNIWSEPVTVFLNGPCDLMPAGQPGLCRRRP